MEKVANVRPDSSSGLFCYHDIGIDIPFFEEYSNDSIDLSNIDFDSIEGDFFFFENSQMAAFCADRLLCVTVYSDRIEADFEGTKKVFYGDICTMLDSILEGLIQKNAYITCQINYHAINLLEDIYSVDSPYIVLNVYRKNVLVDKLTGKKTLLVSSKEFEEAAEVDLKRYQRTLFDVKSNVVFSTPKEYYISTVKQAKEDIRNGEIFQIVLSQMILVKSNILTNHLFYTMKERNPSEYSIVINNKESQIICFSPETLIRKKGNTVKTFPIAGTYRINEGDDIAKKKIEILKDKKEISEHVMLVDLARNDLGRISKPGTVKVEEYLRIKRLYNLIHIYSVVTGELEEKSLTKAILSVFPAGTLTGAPKIRAMQLIEKYERQRRDLYGGAIGYIYKDQFDLAIAIRMAVKDKKESIIKLQSGAGIVNLSVPENEYQECLTKLRAFLRIMEVDENDIVNR
ncbi:anthranilate synthase component I family protein [Anaerocellum danielii]|uniref:Anthranilate synthase component I family protein n=1 Tax=Anaerocellum danielii TaxID=1387557 RepID=A0ABZ0TWM2_9FIRM|nr:anthranilate synthase component I family protein [Caldicellulosiruptor danielii]WPX07842.1 anthranilate synthase component I family protein [Caldicellulosiruptor danielii]